MKYERPEMVVLTSAVRAIQSCTSSKSDQTPDCGNHETPSGAYEADE
jgi:hypothetical protein